MSKFHRTSTTFRDRECLVAALNDQGYATVEVHDVAQQLFDYTGKPTHYTRAAGDVANVIVRRRFIPGLPNDLGFVFNEETKTFDAIVSEYDSSRHNATWFGALTAKYAERKVLKTTKALGFTNLAKPVRKNGKLILEVVR